MTSQTSFNLDDAKNLIRQLRHFYEHLEQNWSKVAQKWAIVKDVWQDEQFAKFEPLFENLSTLYQQELQQGEAYLNWLMYQVETVENKNSTLKSLEGLETANLSANAQRKRTNGHPLSPLSNQIHTSSTSSIHPPQNISLITLKSNASGSVYQHKVTQFAKDLCYQVKYGSLDHFEVGTSARIEAFSSPHQSSLGFINVKKESNNRVYIQDTVVANNYRKQGIGTLLFYHLEQKLPDGTQLYFIDNQAPEGYWEKRGFQQMNNNGVTEYCKTLANSPKQT